MANEPIQDLTAKRRHEDTRARRNMAELTERAQMVESPEGVRYFCPCGRRLDIDMLCGIATLRCRRCKRWLMLTHPDIRLEAETTGSQRT